MHIHGNPISQINLGASQSTLQATEARKAAADVRRKLNSFAINEDDDLVFRLRLISPSAIALSLQRRK